MVSLLQCITPKSSIPPKKLTLSGENDIFTSKKGSESMILVVCFSAKSQQNMLNQRHCKELLGAMIDQLAAACWLLAAGCWLLAALCCLLAAGCWLLVPGWFAAGCRLQAAGCWLLASGC